MNSEGYEALAAEDTTGATPGAWAVDMKQQQDLFAADTETALMDTYNALYKLQESIPPVCMCLRGCDSRSVQICPLHFLRAFHASLS